MAHLRSVFGASLLLALVAACGGNNGVGPMKPADPLQTAANVQGISANFSSPMFESFSLAGQYSPAPAGPVGTIRALLSTAAPALAGRPLSFVEGGRAAAALRAALVAPSGGISATVLPDTLLGKTFEWDTVNSTGYVKTDRTGAPTKGVRFILYALNVFGSSPVLPLQEVGYADLIDESTSSVQQLHIVVVGLDPARTYLDYTISGTSTASSGTVTVVGYITNGTRRLDFHCSLTFNATSAAFDIAFDVNAENAHVRLKLTLTQPTATTLRIGVDFRLQFGSEVVTVTGTDTIDTGTGSETGTLTVRVNGGVYATITITDNNVSYTGGGGQQLTGDDLTALQAIFAAINDVLDGFDALLAPAGTIA
jgi:hypothetical protein